MEQEPLRLLSIAGSDPTGGAGLQADLKTFSSLGAYGLTVVTAVTVQDTHGVAVMEPLAAELVRRQIDALVADIGVDGVKVGMLGDAAIARTVGLCLERLGDGIPIVIDPILASSGGESLLQGSSLQPVVEHLFPLARLITPNALEAGAILGRPVRTRQEQHAAVRDLGALALNVLLTGGHLPGNNIVDVLWSEGRLTEMIRPRLDSRSTHGTGCALSSAIAVLLARGEGLHKAVESAIRYVRLAMELGFALGEGSGQLNHFGAGQRAAKVYNRSD